MSLLLEIFRLVSIAAFLGYGGAGLFSEALTAEFKRYGLAGMRIPVCFLEFLGAVGLIVSYSVPSIGVYAAGGLALLMALGVLTRIRIRDSVLQALPALTLFLVNAALCFWLQGAV